MNSAKDANQSSIFFLKHKGCQQLLLHHNQILKITGKIQLGNYVYQSVLRATIAE